MDQEQLAKDILKEFIELGDDLKSELWTAQNKQFLDLIAKDIAGLSQKIVQTTDPTKRARYQRSIDVLTHHVAVMAYSRLNVVQKETSETVFRVLEKATVFLVKAVLGRFGVPMP
jgi:hypothetical protein